MMPDGATRPRSARCRARCRCCARCPTSAHPARRGAAGGEGIGLAIVKRLCELLDASLELQSEPGRGTTFRIVFPRGY